MSHPNVFDLMAELGTPASNDWRLRFAMLIQRCFDESFQGQATFRWWDTLRQTVADQTPCSIPEIDDAFRDHLYDVVAFGGLLGYALARTWPNGFDEFDNWLQRALAIADVKIG